MELLNQLKLLADYNQLMNRRLFGAARKLSSDELKMDRGAYFKSILGTLNHILVGDLIWLNRLANHHPSHFLSLKAVQEMTMPSSLDAILYNEIEELWDERQMVDSAIVCWMNELEPLDLEQPLHYKNMAGHEFKKQTGSLIVHLYNHQTHHRGQLTTLLSQAGVDFGATDLIEIISDL